MVNTKFKINPPFSLARIFGRGDNQNIRSLDFQPTDVILGGKLPIALPYEQTSLEMVIHIDRVRRGKNGHVNKVIQLTLEFTSEGVTYSVEHVCDLEGIFPLLEFTSRFSGFSFTFQKHSSHDSLLDYQQFVREQIQNHQRYGVHLPFPPGRVFGFWVTMILMAGSFLFFFYVILPSDAAQKDSWGIGAVSAVMAVAALACAWNLWRYYQAKSKLKRMKNRR